jgi:hypothetical protein
VRRAVLAVWDFVVGDDWVTAAGVVLAVAATAALQGAGISAWWVMPLAIFVLLTHSLLRAGRSP